MKIEFSPQAAVAPQPLVMFRAGDVLTVNGAALDFSSLEDGQNLPAYDEDGNEVANTGHEQVNWVKRRDGQLLLSVMLHYSGDAPEAVRFPEPVEMDADGPVPVPGGVQLEPEG